jgi:hypothetical protein
MKTHAAQLFFDAPIDPFLALLEMAKDIPLHHFCLPFPAVHPKHLPRDVDFSK